MSDQPKPATGGDATCPTSQSSSTSMDATPLGSNVAPTVQPVGAAKPTGEWTARKAATGYVAGLYCGNTEIYRQSLGALEDLERIADAHNAALGAEREKYSEWHKEALLRTETIQQLRSQLAAEMEKVQTLMAILKAADQQNWIRAEDNPGYNRHE